MYPNSNVHPSCTAERVSSNIPPPPAVFFSPLAFLSHSSCPIDVQDGEAKILAFLCFLKEELRGGQGVTLGKVTDERAAEEKWL